MYYLIFNKKTGAYYCNKSENPEKSIESHIRRANNPNSTRYNTALHKALREEGIDAFTFYKLDKLPSWVSCLMQYVND